LVQPLPTAPHLLGAIADLILFYDMRNTIFTLLLAGLMAQLGWSQAAKNMSLLSNVPYPHATSDAVGYVAAGVEYAVVVHQDGTTLFSLANPSSPVVIQEIQALTFNLWHEVDIYQHYAYVSTEAADGLRIIDLSSLPGQCAYKDTVINGMVTGHTLMVDGDRLYVYGANTDNGGASVYSLTDPWNPVYIGGYQGTYVHDAYVRNDTCYMGDIYNGYMTMVDMTNPLAPVTLGSVLTPSAFTHNSWLNDAGNICFTTDEVDAAYVAAYDVSNPSNIVEVGRYRSSLSNGLAIPHNVKVLNDFLVVAYYKDGVNIVDASRPHNMIEVGYYDTHPATGGGFDGIWGLECYLPSGHIVACDMSQGVFVLDPTYVRACYLEGQVTDATNGTPLPGATVAILSTVASDAAGVNGEYATGLADAGTYTVRYSKYGYRDSVITVTLANGVLNTQDIALYPNPRVSMTVHVVEAGTGNPIPNAKVVFNEISNNVSTSYVSDVNGQVVDTSFMASNYDLLAGQWGYVTSSTIVNVTATTTSLTVTLDKGYYDDFVFDYGWTVASTATSGEWERGEPVGTPFFSIFANPEEDVVGDHGDQCYVTGNGGGGPFDDDVDQGTTTMTSPMMDLSGYTNPWLIFDYWFLTVTQNGGAGFRDTLKIEIDNGIETKTVWFQRDLQQPVWVTDTVQIASYLQFTNTMQISISCSDRFFDQVIEAGIDRLRIEDQSFVATEPDAAAKPQLEVYPNPSHGRNYLRYDLQAHRAGMVRVLDLDGRELRRMPVDAPTGVMTLDMELPAGMYFVVLEVDGQRLATQKLIRY
jgi:choice-of-anchor B domain-containing protein